MKNNHTKSGDAKLQKILQLPSHVADLIAAGEVVQRPSSVVKELIENAIDAGAGIITVEIKDGGMTFIRVSDNGSGIAPDDVKVAFLRHATSKIRNAQGLEAIGTLGFRGEALAAIAAVSRIELTTREQGADEGVSLILEAGNPGNVSPVGCPEGTTIVVRDLFFNTPARLKFIKSNRAEGAQVASTVLFAALSHPEVSVRFIKDGKTEFHTPGDFRADSCIYSLFGRDFSSGLIAVNSEKSENNNNSQLSTLNSPLPSVSGYVSNPNMSRGNRSFQYFILNGRPIRSKMLQAALEQAYANLLPSGRFPSCVLYITTKLSDVDVNVHPTKTEVRFISDKDVFDAVYYAVKGAVSNSEFGIRNSELSNAECGMQNAELSNSPQFVQSSKSGGFRSLSVNEYNKSYGKSQSSESVIQGLTHNPPNHQKTIGDCSSEVRVTNVSTNNSPLSSLLSPLPPFKLIGEALSTYIILEVDGSLNFIDKHAAHERIHFNALKSGNYDPMSQTLIVPSVCRFSAGDFSLLMENADFLDSLGFSIEAFGDDSIAIRRIPSELGIDDIEPVLSSLCEHFSLGDYAETERLDKIYRTIACGSSIKAGALSEANELEALAARVVSGEITHCPHGRPVMFELTKAALDKEFRRG